MIGWLASLSKLSLWWGNSCNRVGRNHENRMHRTDRVVTVYQKLQLEWDFKNTENSRSTATIAAGRRKVRLLERKSTQELFLRAALLTATSATAQPRVPPRSLRERCQLAFPAERGSEATRDTKSHKKSHRTRSRTKSARSQTDQPWQVSARKQRFQPRFLHTKFQKICPS